MLDANVIGSFPVHELIQCKRDEIFPKIIDYIIENNIVCCNFHLTKLTEESVLGIIVFKLYRCTFCVYQREL